MKTTQCDRILRYLNDYGSISQLEAMQYFGCYRLAARIKDLKNRGYKIKKVTETGRNRYNEPMSWARYMLIKEVETIDLTS